MSDRYRPAGSVAPSPAIYAPRPNRHGALDPKGAAVELANLETWAGFDPRFSYGPAWKTRTLAAQGALGAVAPVPHLRVFPFSIGQNAAAFNAISTPRITGIAIIRDINWGVTSGSVNAPSGLELGISPVPVNLTAQPATFLPPWQVICEDLVNGNNAAGGIQQGFMASGADNAQAKGNIRLDYAVNQDSFFLVIGARMPGVGGNTFFGSITVMEGLTSDQVAQFLN